MGALTLSTSLTDGDAFNSLTLDYSAELAEGLSLDLHCLVAVRPAA